MYPEDPSVTGHLRHQRLLEEAAYIRLVRGAAPLPAPPWRERVATARRTVGYRLVEAGLRLAVGGASQPGARGLGSRPPP